MGAILSTRITSAVQINIAADAVSQLSFSDIHATVQQVDDCLFAAVLDHLQTADRHSRCVLRDAILSSTDRAVLAHVQHFKATIAVSVIRCGVRVHDLLQDDVTATKGFHVSAFLQPAQECVVVCYVICQLACPGLNISGDDVRNATVGECHNLAPEKWLKSITHAVELLG